MSEVRPAPPTTEPPATNGNPSADTLTAYLKAARTARVRGTRVAPGAREDRIARTPQRPSEHVRPEPDTEGPFPDTPFGRFQEQFLVATDDQLQARIDTGGDPQAQAVLDLRRITDSILGTGTVPADLPPGIDLNYIRQLYEDRPGQPRGLWQRQHRRLLALLALQSAGGTRPPGTAAPGETGPSSLTSHELTSGQLLLRDINHHLERAGGYEQRFTLSPAVLQEFLHTSGRDLLPGGIDPSGLRLQLDGDVLVLTGEAGNRFGGFKNLDVRFGVSSHGALEVRGTPRYKPTGMATKGMIDRQLPTIGSRLPTLIDRRIPGWHIDGFSIDGDQDQIGMEVLRLARPATPGPVEPRPGAAGAPSTPVSTDPGAAIHFGPPPGESTLSGADPLAGMASPSGRVEVTPPSSAAAAPRVDTPSASGSTPRRPWYRRWFYNETPDPTPTSSPVVPVTDSATRVETPTLVSLSPTIRPVVPVTSPPAPTESHDPYRRPADATRVGSAAPEIPTEVRPAVPEPDNLDPEDEDAIRRAIQAEIEAARRIAGNPLQGPDRPK